MIIESFGIIGHYFQIKICTGKIIEPTSSMCSDNIIKVTAGLIASLTFVAELNNLREYLFERMD